MLKTRKAARDFLLYSDRPTFLEVVYRAKITPRQKEIVYKKFLDGEDNNYIADSMSICCSTVRNELQYSYDLLYCYLLNARLLPH